MQNHYTQFILDPLYCMELLDILSLLNSVKDWLTMALLVH